MVGNELIGPEGLTLSPYFFDFRISVDLVQRYIV